LFTANAFCSWRRAALQIRRGVHAKSRAFAMRPMLLQWSTLVREARRSLLPTRAKHIAQLLRAQAASREILLHPRNILALCKHSQLEFSHQQPYWSQPLQDGALAITTSKTNALQLHTISAKPPSASRPSSQPSAILSRTAAGSRLPSSAATSPDAARALTKRCTGQR
jgi:hypothetical protein